MEILIKCAPSAFKHGVTESNIRYAILNWMYDDILENDPDKYLLIGFDDNANLLEIMYNVVDGQNVRVFHAMKCRIAFLSLLNKI